MASAASVPRRDCRSSPSPSVRRRPLDNSTPLLQSGVGRSTLSMTSTSSGSVRRSRRIIPQRIRRQAYPRDCPSRGPLPWPYPSRSAPLCRRNIVRAGVPSCRTLAHCRRARRRDFGYGYRDSFSIMKSRGSANRADAVAIAPQQQAIQSREALRRWAQVRRRRPVPPRLRSRRSGSRFED